MTATKTALAEQCRKLALVVMSGSGAHCAARLAFQGGPACSLIDDPNDAGDRDTGHARALKFPTLDAAYAALMSAKAVAARWAP